MMWGGNPLRVLQIMNGPGCLQGYRSVLHTLQLRGKRVPRIVVHEPLRKIDLEVKQ